MIYYGIKPESFGQLGSIGRQIQKQKKDSTVIKVKFLRPYGVAYLQQFAQNHKRSVPGFRVASTYGELNQYLRQCGFDHLEDDCLFGPPFPQDDIISIQTFLGDPLRIEMAVVNWITSKLLPFIPRLAPQLRKKIVENLWEVVNNGMTHGLSPNGVTTTGQFYPNKGYFEVAFYEQGFGIPAVVRKYGQVPASASDSECINWAIQMGHTTKPPGGLGLHILREFLKVNGGSIQIVSGNGYFGQSAKNSACFLSLRNSIPGTLVNIRVVFDDHLYQLRGEDQ